MLLLLILSAWCQGPIYIYVYSIHVHVHVYVYVYVYVTIYIYTYTHIYIYINCNSFTLDHVFCFHVPKSNRKVAMTFWFHTVSASFGIRLFRKPFPGTKNQELITKTQFARKLFRTWTCSIWTWEWTHLHALSFKHSFLGKQYAYAPYPFDSREAGTRCCLLRNFSGAPSESDRSRAAMQK